mmetsp:Transcript_10956/g.21797  ORF Transcript_10956/g.21797 Transcript_10956/m.21797 type:complete len:136 (+) Transcript_10956:212-619(+)
MPSADSSASGSSSGDDDDVVSRAIEKYLPFASEITLSSFLGYTAGVFSKSLSHLAFVSLGGVFLGLQALSHLDYVTVNWPKIQRDFTAAADVDGDGKITKRDVQVYWGRVRRIAELNLPKGGGFGAGFLMGFFTN